MSFPSEQQADPPAVSATAAAQPPPAPAESDNSNGDVKRIELQKKLLELVNATALQNIEN